MASELCLSRLGLHVRGVSREAGPAVPRVRVGARRTGPRAARLGRDLTLAFLLVTFVGDHVGHPNCLSKYGEI